MTRGVVLTAVLRRADTATSSYMRTWKIKYFAHLCPNKSDLRLRFINLISFLCSLNIRRTTICVVSVFTSSHFTKQEKSQILTHLCEEAMIATHFPIYPYIISQLYWLLCVNQKLVFYSHRQAGSNHAIFRRAK